MNRFTKWRLNRMVPQGFRVDIFLEPDSGGYDYVAYGIPVTEEALNSVVFNGPDRKFDDLSDYKLPMRSRVWWNHDGISTYDASVFDLKVGDKIFSGKHYSQKQAFLSVIDAIRNTQKYASVRNNPSNSLISFGDRREIEQ